MKQVNYDEVSKTYDSRYKNGLVEGIEAAITDLVLNMPIKSVLDVGCGSGAYLEAFNKSVSSYGLDNSASMLSKARERKSSAVLVRGTALRIPFVSSIFDLVTCIHAIHHFETR
jgi:ubiquinone/menaquinone biosynthesis C-methylase UbiE